MILGHLIEAAEILLVLTISMLNANFEPMEVTLVITDGTTPRDCTSGIACFFPKDNSIWIRYDQIDRVDSCGRDVLMHEFLHARYYQEGIHVNVHTNCDLDQRMFITDIKINRSWLTTI